MTARASSFDKYDLDFRTVDRRITGALSLRLLFLRRRHRFFLERTAPTVQHSLTENAGPFWWWSVGSRLVAVFPSLTVRPRNTIEKDGPVGRLPTAGSDRNVSGVVTKVSMLLSMTRPRESRRSELGTDHHRCPSICSRLCMYTCVCVREHN